MLMLMMMLLPPTPQPTPHALFLFRREEPVYLLQDGGHLDCNALLALSHPLLVRVAFSWRVVRRALTCVLRVLTCVLRVLTCVRARLLDRIEGNRVGGCWL